MTLDVSVGEDRRALRVSAAAAEERWEGEHALTDLSVWGEASRAAARGSAGLLRGQALAELLLPKEALSLLSREPHPVTLGCDEDAAQLPWERLVLPGGLPERLVSRRLTRRLLASPCRAPEWGLRLRVLLLADLAGDGGASRAEGDELSEILAAHPGVDLLRPAHLGSEELIRCLSEGPRVDLLHFSGRAAVCRGLELSDGEVFSAEHLSRLDARRLPSVLFLNGCGTAEIAPGLTLAGALLRAGVCALIGARGQIRASAAWRVSEIVYRALVEGETLGAALAQARRWLEETEHWGTYVVYGDPSCRFPRLRGC